MPKNIGLITRFFLSRIGFIIFFTSLAFSFQKVPFANAQQTKITNLDTKYTGDNSVGITLNMTKPSSGQSQTLKTQYNTTILLRNSRQIATMSKCGGGDGFCDMGIEDNPASSKYCPSDCQGYCGNGKCEAGENCVACPGDCPCTCGDGQCTAGETCLSCPADCGGSCCGNGTCEDALGEDCNSCLDDCGDCGPVLP